jgi:diguanylate cyclase (GGDEF)-like protein
MSGVFAFQSLGSSQGMILQSRISARLQQIFLWSSSSVFVFAMIGFVFDANFKPLWLLGHLVFFAVIYGANHFLYRRYSVKSTGFFLTVCALQVIFALYQEQVFWTQYALGGVIYGICVIPLLFVIATNLGLTGLLIDLFLSGILISLSFQHGLGAGLIVAFASGLATLIGFMCYQLFREFASLQDELERNATTDALTKIGNRRALEQDFERYQAIGRRKGMQLVLSSWDVDGLKRINDEQGHRAGDQYLLRCVRALQHATRKGDGLYRTGGDEFVGLHLGLTAGTPIVERVRGEFFNVSVGFSVFTQESLDRALSDADAQMYAEKRHRKNKSGRATGEYYARNKAATRASSEDRLSRSTGIEINVHTTGIDISVRNTGEMPVNITKDHDVGRLTLEPDLDTNITLELDPRDLHARLETTEKPN